MKIRRQLDDIYHALSMLWQLDRALFIVSIFHSFFSSCIPFIEIQLSAYVLDQLHSGLDFQPFFRSILPVLTGICLLNIGIAYLKKVIDVHTSLCVQKFDMLMGIRTLTMDYELLEAPTVNQIRSKIQSDNDWGAGFYSVIWQFPTVMTKLFHLLLSIIILVPLFTESTLFRDYSALVILILTAGLIAFHVVYSGKLRNRMHALLDTSSKRSYRGYYIWNNREYKIGMDLRIYNGQKVIEHYLKQEYETIDKSWIMRSTFNQSKNGLSGGLCSGIMQAGAYLFVAFRALSGTLSIGSFTKYATVIYRFSQALTSCFSLFSEFALSAKRQRSTLEYINFSDVLPKGTIPVEKRSLCDNGDNEYELELRDVSFKYPGSDNWALRNVSLKLRIGEHLAIVGMNGSGKTTLIKLLCRLYDPTEGSILLNGVDIRKYDYSEYISLFSVVFQDFKLFAFSLGQNVASSSEYDKEKVEKCLEKAGFKDRYQSMPDADNTFLYKGFDENGLEISGGEAQKIALARALYKDAPFVVLDEPTAALDPIAEFDIYSRFNEFVNNKTAIYISHRLSSCRFCDDIAVFHEGRLIQRGNHDTLIADPAGKYYELWNAQAQYYE